MSAAIHANKKRKPLQRALRILASLVATALLIIALAAAWAWSNRYELVERQAITYLGSLGIDADLKIRSANGKSADIRNIRLSYEDDPFLTIDRLQASYQWRELLNGAVERLVFTGLDATVTVDETGQIVDGWRPPSTGNGGVALPPGGIEVERGTILLKTPFGNVPVSGDAAIKSLEAFTFDGRLAETTLTRGDVSVTAAGPVSIERQGKPVSVEAPETQLTLNHPSGNLRDTVLSTTAIFNPDDSSLLGRARLQGGAFDASAGLAGKLTWITIDGQWVEASATADVDAQITDLTVRDANRRISLSRTLSLADLLSDIPVAQNFAPSLVGPIADLLVGSEVDASVALSLNNQQRELSLRGPMTVKTKKTTAILSPVTDAPFYRYQSNSGEFSLNTQIDLSRPLPLSLSPLNVRIRSNDGLTIDGVASATGQFKTRAPWRARTRAGRPARLDPLSVGFEYDAPLDSPSRLMLRGAIDYDGDIPGGYVENLVAGGVLNTRLNAGRTQLDYKPSRKLTLSKLETPSEWIVENFSGSIIPRSPIYARTASGVATIQTNLSDASFSAVRPATDELDAATLFLEIGSAKIAGQVQNITQNWDVGFSDVSVKSETFPVIGTDLTLPEGELTIGLSSDTPLSFSMTAPASTLITPGYVVRGMAVDAAGTIEHYTMNYSGGRVRMIPQTENAIPLPVLPISGDLTVDAGIFSGQALTFLPRVPDTPVNIVYRMIDGQGEADVTIDRLRFKPGGLQPQELAPALRGKIARVDGIVDAKLHILFGGETPPSGTGSIEIFDMSLGTAPGPVTGLSGQIELTSLFPVVTAPDQRLRIRSFDPGFPLENGELVYALVADGVEISEAVFPFGEGQVSFDPFTWVYSAVENRVVLRVAEVEIGEFLKDIGNGRLSATGTLVGTIPVVVRGIDVRVDDGRLEVRNGGTIRFKSEGGADALPNEYAQQAIKALEDFNYEALFLEIDGPLDGDIEMGVLFTGSNPEVLYGVPFQFAITVEGELFNIARSLNPNGLQERIVASVVSQQQTDSQP